MAASNSGSIRTRLIAGSLLATAAAIAVAGIAIGRDVQRRLRAQHTGTLLTVLELGANRAAADVRRIESRGETEGTLFANSGDGVIGRPVHLWRARRFGGGHPAVFSGGFPEGLLPPVEELEERTTKPVVTDVVADGGEHFRVASFRLTPADFEPRSRDRDQRPPGPPGFRGERGPRRPRPQGGRPPFRSNEQFDVAVAMSTEGEHETLAELRRSLLFGGGGAILATALLLWFVIARGLFPLTALARRVAAINVDRIGEPIDFPNAANELQPIVTAFEDTRGRLANAFARERRFTSDAAHELRTPLAGLRATLEVLLRRQRSVEEHRNGARDCLSLTTSMQDIVDSLLILARSDGSDQPTAPIDLRECIVRAFELRASDMEARQLTLTHAGIDGGSAEGIVNAVPGFVDRIASNLASNAVSYATSGSSIEVSIEMNAGQMALSVTNTCQPLPGDAASLAFEPFWRADAARTLEGLHVGLGLPLVAKAVEALGGEVAAKLTHETKERDRFTVTVNLPRA